MSALIYLLAGLFLPLFPFSMGFNALFGATDNSLLRAALLLAWPQIGLTLASMSQASSPAVLVPLALATSALYAFRALALREVGQWTGYLATSLWALFWLPATLGTATWLVHLLALAVSAPLVLLVLLTGGLRRRFGAAYTGLYGGLAEAVPRLAGVLVVVVLASVATPVFPAFFAILGMVVIAVPQAPATAAVLVVIWLLWSWAGTRLLQGLIVGPASRGSPGTEIRDLSYAATGAYAGALIALAVAGLALSGTLA